MAEHAAMTLQIEDEITKLLQVKHESPEQTARELIVLELFRQRRISGRKAAELLKVSREQFIRKAGDAGISYLDYDADELAQEFSAVASLKIENRR